MDTGHVIIGHSGKLLNEQSFQSGQYNGPPMFSSPNLGLANPFSDTPQKTSCSMPSFGYGAVQSHTTTILPTIEQPFSSNLVQPGKPISLQSNESSTELTQTLQMLKTRINNIEGEIADLQQKLRVSGIGNGGLSDRPCAAKTEFPFPSVKNPLDFSQPPKPSVPNDDRCRASNVLDRTRTLTEIDRNSEDNATFNKLQQIVRNSNNNTAQAQPPRPLPFSNYNSSNQRHGGLYPLGSQYH